ncbi:MAG: DUF948 domain-containing protein [Rhabdochlamydiaceae bacterium]|nr:DUF948 domain-containing protein [Rhabdochlamydiaceae bacterium]
MVIDVVVGVIGSAFVVLVVFLVIALQRLLKVIKKSDVLLSELHDVLNDFSSPSLELVENTNALIVDIQKKSEGLDCLFRPLYAIKKEKFEQSNGAEKISGLIECLAEGVRFFGKIKNEMK